MGTFLSSVVFKWWLRRFLELGPIVSGALTWWMKQPPDVQQTVLAFLSGNWATVGLGSLVTIGGYVWSLISTKRNQIVVDGQQVPLKEIGRQAQQTAVEEIARTAIEKRGKTLMEMLGDKLNAQWKK